MVISSLGECPEYHMVGWPAQALDSHRGVYRINWGLLWKYAFGYKIRISHVRCLRVAQARRC